MFKGNEVNTTIVDNSADLKNSDALIIPGVGAFKSGMDTLMSSRILEDINIAEQKTYSRNLSRNAIVA